MKRVIITVGLGFGDEGKGATIDHLARRLDADLVVRYCGGSQAGHNVQLPDGRRHTFSQFGAGTLARAERPSRTYLGPNVVIDPPALLREARHLAELGVDDPTALVTVHPRCLVATVWHRALNQLREMARGADRHGSCGQGIGEARSYWLRHGEDAVFAADLRDPHVLRAKLELLRQRALLEMQDLVGQIGADDLRSFDLWELNTEAVARLLGEMGQTGIAFSPEVPELRHGALRGGAGRPARRVPGLPSAHHLEHRDDPSRLGTGTPDGGGRGRRAGHHPGLLHAPRRRAVPNTLHGVNGPLAGSRQPLEPLAGQPPLRLARPAAAPLRRRGGRAPRRDRPEPPGPVCRNRGLGL